MSSTNPLPRDVLDLIESAVAGTVPSLKDEYVAMIVSTTLMFLFESVKADPVLLCSVLAATGNEVSPIRHASSLIAGAKEGDVYGYLVRPRGEQAE